MIGPYGQTRGHKYIPQALWPSHERFVCTHINSLPAVLALKRVNDLGGVIKLIARCRRQTIITAPANALALELPCTDQSRHRGTHLVFSDAQGLRSLYHAAHPQHPTPCLNHIAIQG